MTKPPKIELVLFEGCPNAAEARENLRAAVAGALPQPVEWAEWDLLSDTTPSCLKRYGSPTVLVDGHDVTGRHPRISAIACRTDGAPSIDVIAAKLARSLHP